MYKNSIPYPNGQVAGEELFQSGFIPSDTDFRIFRDFGNIPGTFVYIKHLSEIKYYFFFQIDFRIGCCTCYKWL